MTSLRVGPEDLTLAGATYEAGHDATHDAILLDLVVDLEDEERLILRRMGGPFETSLGTATVSRVAGGGLQARAVALGQRAAALAGLPYLSLGVDLGDGGKGVTPRVSWVSVTDRPTFPGQPPYRLTRVPDPQAWQALLRGVYDAVHVPDDEGNDYHVEWWHRDDPGLNMKGVRAVG